MSPPLDRTMFHTLRGRRGTPRAAALAVGLLSILAVGGAARAGARACTPPPTWPDGTTIPGGGGQRFADLPYWSGTTAKLDVYLPTGWQGNDAVPTIFFLHGGGGYTGDKNDSSVNPFYYDMVRRGHPVVAANYTLASPSGHAGSVPESLHDARAALSWIRRGTDVATAGTDVCLSACIVVVGSSAGAGIAAMLGTTWNANDEGFFDTGIPGADGRADLVVCVSGLFDLYGLGANGHCPPSKCYGAPFWVQFPADGVCGPRSGWPTAYPELSPWEWNRLPWGGTLGNGLWPPEAMVGCQWGSGGCPQPDPGTLPTNVLTGNVFADASPLNWVDAADAPFYLIHGECDPLSPYGLAASFHAALQAAAVPSHLRTISSSGHGIGPRGGGGNGLVTPAEAAAEVEAAIVFWMNAGGCDRAYAIRYGCGVNPARSVRVLAGRPRIGTTFTLGLDNPLGTQASGAIPIVILSTAPDARFPCGTPLPGFGMSGAGELLIALTPAHSQPVWYFGPPWAGPGSPSPVSIPIPNDAILVGLPVYSQGLLLDSPGASVRFGLTDAVELRIGV